MPDPPPLDRRLMLGGGQWLGVLALVAVPVLAMAGVFGERTGRADARVGGVAVGVAWPTRTRHEMIHQIEVEVRNLSDRAVDTMRVAFEGDYLDAFTARTFTPSATGVWEVALSDVRPGESRRVVVEIDANRYGRHVGAVSATDGGADTARVALHTTIFP